MYIKPVFSLIIVLFVAFPGARAQDAGPHAAEEKVNHPYISWVSQYPAHKENEERQNTVKKIYNFLVQKGKQTSITRPVGVIGEGPANFWVLDQGEELLAEVKKNKLEIPRAIRKKDNYFTSLVGVCELPGNDILFTDSRLNKLFVYSKENKKVTTLNDTLQLQQPTGVAYSASTGNIWVTETGAHRLLMLNSRGEVVKRIGIRGSEQSEFNYPTSIWIDKVGDVYVVDAMNFRVQIFDKDGMFLTMFGEAGDATGDFARPKGIATDSYGNIYVADALFHAVQIFDRQGHFLYTFGKQGRDKGEFWMPAGIYIDSRNYIYVADSYNSRIQVFQLINGG